MGLKTIVKVVLISVLLQFLGGCGFKSLVVPNLDWLLERKLVKELNLNAKQKKALKKDVDSFLEGRKIQAKRLSKKLESLDLNTLNAERLSEDFFFEYKDFLKAFLPIYSKYLSQLSQEQLVSLEENFREKNDEIKERIEDFSIEKSIDRYEEFFGDLSEKQKNILEGNSANFLSVSKERLERRISYQKSLLEILKEDVSSTAKQEKIEKLSWDYNTDRSRSEALKKNTEASQKVFDLVDQKQRDHLKRKLADIQSWIGRFLEENYL
jgi:hypothetical protein